MDRLDVRRDGMGVWTEGHCRTKIPFRGKTKSQESECDSYVWRIVYSCKSQPTLRRTEIYRKNREGQLQSPVFIQYSFEGKPTSFDILPHGNSRSALPFHPTDRSLLKEIHESTTEEGVSAMKVYNKVRIKSIIYHKLLFLGFIFMICYMFI